MYIGNFINKFAVTAVPINGYSFFVYNCRLYFIKQCSKVSHLNMVTGTYNSSAFGMPKYYNNFGTHYLSGKLHTAKYILVQYISGYTDAKYIAQALIKNKFGRGAAINTAKNSCKRE